MAQEKDLISIIIPVYNVENYLDRCLESVINQDYQNIEVILVDDGSSDSSPDICEKWKTEYPQKIKVLHQENQGASLARKCGIELSTGSYFAFVDSDDYISPRYISTLYSAAIDSGALLSVCPFSKISVGEEFDFVEIEKSNNCTLTSDDVFSRFFKYEFWAFWGGIYHRSLFDKIIYPTATINEDYFVKAQIFSKVDKVGYCPAPLYVYEIHPGSLSQLKLSSKALGEFDNAISTWKYVSAHIPRYKNHALAIASEATCKWLSVINQTSKEEANAFEDYKNMMQVFIQHNFCQIFANRHFLWKIKIVLLIEYLKSSLK